MNAYQGRIPESEYNFGLIAAYCSPITGTLFRCQKHTKYVAHFLVDLGHSQEMKKVTEHENIFIVFIFMSHFILTVVFSLGPIFEGPDELEHYRYIKTIADTNTLPDPAGQILGEYHQAPLYYLLNVPVMLMTKSEGLDDFSSRRNPWHGVFLEINGNNNKNVILHSSNEQFPYTNSPIALSVHILRIISTVFSLLTLYVSHRILLHLWPTNRSLRLSALSFTAFLPQFMYISSIVNNDNLLILLATVSLYCLLRQVDNPTPRNAILLGIALGGILLTKVSALSVGFPVGIALASNKKQWKFIPLTLLISILISGWWYFRNWLLYSDPFNMRAWQLTWGLDHIDSNGLDIRTGLTRSWWAYQTFWARFGHGAVSVSKTLYAIFGLVTIFTIIGLLLKVIRQIREKQLAKSSSSVFIIAVFIASWIVALVYSSSTAQAGNQGRYLLPALAGFGALFAVGLDGWSWIREGFKNPLLSAIVLFSLACSSYYYFWESYTILEVPETIKNPLNYNYEGQAMILGIDPAVTYAHPGDRITIALYWQALQKPTQQYLVYLKALEDLRISVDSYPATGNLMSTDWYPGLSWAEEHWLQIPEDAAAGEYNLIAGLYDFKKDYVLSFSKGNSDANLPFVGVLIIEDKDQ